MNKLALALEFINSRNSFEWNASPIPGVCPQVVPLARVQISSTNRLTRGSRLKKIGECVEASMLQRTREMHINNSIAVVNHAAAREVCLM